MDLQFVAFFALAMTFLSLWIHRSAWLWGSFLAISLILAFQSGVAKPYSLAFIGSLFLIHWLLKHNVGGKERLILVSLATFISIGLWFHKIPGFCNVNIEGSFWANYDKPFIGLFILAFQLNLVRSVAEWQRLLAWTIPLTILTVVVLLAIVSYSGTVQWDPSWPHFFFFKMTTNLFFATIPEEAFFRGFIQEELFRLFGKGFKGHVGSVGAAALFFALMHVLWAPSFAVLGLIFLAGLFYGAIYQYTRAIESSIICHFTVNFIRIMFFKM